MSLFRRQMWVDDLYPFRRRRINIPPSKYPEGCQVLVSGHRDPPFCPWKSSKSVLFARGKVLFQFPKGRPTPRKPQRSRSPEAQSTLPRGRSGCRKTTRPGAWPRSWAWRRESKVNDFVWLSQAVAKPRLGFVNPLVELVSRFLI